MKKKIMALLLAVSLLFIAGCGSDSESDEPVGGDGTDEVNKIAFIVVGGTLGDQGTNDASDAGISKYAEETGAVYDSFEAPELQDVDAAVRTFCDDGYNLIAFNAATAAEFVPALAEDYPEVKFIVMEGSIEGYDNVANIKTDIGDAAFLSGVFAASMNETITGEKEAGIIGGVRNPELDRAIYGFAAGVSYVGGTATPVYVGSFTDAAKSKELATQMYTQDIRVIQAWAGGANKGVYEAAANMGDGFEVMGAATGQFHMSDKISCSLVKNNDVMFYEVCTSAFNGEWTPGIITYGLKEGGVGLKYAPDGRDAVIPQEVKELIETIEEIVISGEFEVPISEEEFATFTEKYEG